MSSILKVVISVVQRRVNSGEDINTVLLDYPKLTQSEIDIIKQNIKV